MSSPFLQADPPSAVRLSKTLGHFVLLLETTHALEKRRKISVMSKHKFIVFLIAVAAATVNAQTPSHIGQYETSSKDTDAILQVTKDFRAALTTKDGKKLSALLLNSKILFSSPASPTRARKQKEEVDSNFDGIDAAGASGFIEFVAKSKEPIEEKFYNVKITQDRHVAWVMFDFEFLEDNKVQNYGIEAWQMLKTADDSWKILSVVWSSHGAPK